MDFALSEREQEMTEAFGRLFERESPPAVVRAAEPGGFSPELWAALVAVGVPAMGLPEADGGASVVELALLCELAGRALAPAPVVEALCCVRLLARLGQPGAVAVGAIVDELTAGAIGTVVLRPASAGAWPIVPAGAAAQLAVAAVDGALVVARRSEGRVHPYGHVHGSAPLAAWDLTIGPDDLVVNGVDATAVLDDAVVEWRILTAAALMGLARRALEVGAEYAATRRAFGAPIGRFQGVAHPLADAAVDIDGGTFLVRRAAWLVDQGHRVDAARTTPTPTGPGGPVATDTTARCVHVHGGYGAALEYDIQLFHQRARAWSSMLGDPADDLHAVGTALLGEGRRAAAEGGRWTSS